VVVSRIRKREAPIFVVNLAYILAFGATSIGRRNYEFLIYTAVIVLAFVLIAATQRQVKFTPLVLWGLTIWGLLHMAGGNVFLAGGRLYDLILISIAPKYQILRYDHFVHAVGFGTATLVAYHLLRPHLHEGIHNWLSLSALVALMGMGLGALNEMMEFFVVVVVPESGVGGYTNTALDLVFNALGALLAIGCINVQRLRQSRPLPLV